MTGPQKHTIQTPKLRRYDWKTRVITLATYLLNGVRWDSVRCSIFEWASWDPGIHPWDPGIHPWDPGIHPFR